ncbi:glycoside hydrolase family 95 protein [Paenibacillus profundus]|uniref:Glycoside hydrolase family 95 protein n=1 Tax=Paenibacillus profundus TaxID=1173085 RepID=A0ABS8YJJ6_9BACL|nr:glycoside hydrolase N-terminal domain-containing protein [Paenibacillus profundus]MCE5171971.1 glycoside hydrolase family 95 protein [Paenibacillus profundus]
MTGAIPLDNGGGGKLRSDHERSESERIVKERVLLPHTGPRSYQPFGELWLEDINAQVVEATTAGEGERSDYRRELDLDTAIATVEYVRAGVAHRREMFVSATDQVLVLHWSVDKRQSLSCKLSLTRDGSARIEAIGTDALLLTGQAEHRGTHAGVCFAGCVKAVPQGGHVQADGESLIIRDADSLTVYVAIRTCLQAWASGVVSGLRARGGFEVDIEWKQNRLTRCRIRSLLGRSVRLRYGTAERVCETKAGGYVEWDGC